MSFFSSVRSADRVYVPNRARLVEQGSHEELMATGGLCREVFTLQAEGYQPTSAMKQANPTG